MKILKKSTLSLLAIVLTLGLVGCTSQKKESNKLEEIKNKGVLTIGTSADYPPYEFHKEINGEDKIVGLDIMIAEELAKELGVKLEIKDMKFDGLLGALKSQNIDMVMAGMTPTEERKKAVDFSDTYYNGSNVILVKKENLDKYKTIEDLKNARIGVQKASLQENIVKDVIKAKNIKSLSKIQDIVLELENNNIDAVVISKATTKGYLKQYKDLACTNVDSIEGETEGSAIPVNKSENKAFLNEVNKVLNKLKKEGKIEEFVEKATELAQ